MNPFNNYCQEIVELGGLVTIVQMLVCVFVQFMQQLKVTPHAVCAFTRFLTRKQYSDAIYIDDGAFK